ncbi:MAG: hypothetical protein BM564_09030 [Bacteroidetes bacterium MedPE-SWsnd-G2]|nr:MAG: hypothetical protein BM564_09030 [Bacteroidetes bacterium MedPE-SWsnd-G2]
MNKGNFPANLVSVDWLSNNLSHPNLIVLDATIAKAGNTKSETNLHCIPGALFFDLKYKFADTSSIFPNSLPTKTQFELEAQRLGINNNSIIVVYDNKGVYSSARVWWLFKAMGHQNVMVLNGGLPEWNNKKFKTNTTYSTLETPGNFKATYNPDYFVNFDTVLNASILKSPLILDARSEGRFKGTSPEPRKELKSGHIPNSKNLPFTTLFEENCFKPKSQLTAIYNQLIPNNDTATIFSCGSGITACILVLGADLCGYKNLTVYDGSWTEYATLTSNTKS